MKKEEKFKEALEVIVSMMDGPVREATKAAIRLADEMTKVAQANEPVYRIGNRFKFTGLLGGEYIIARMDLNVALICLETGCPFSNPIEVENPYEITLSDFRKITSNESENFHLIES